MHTILVLREELVCLVILLFLLQYCWKYSEGVNRDRMQRLNLYAAGHVLFDMITVYTVNRLDMVPLWLNRVCHGIFYMFAILFCYEFFCYVLHLTSNEQQQKRLSRIMLLIPVAYALMIPILPVYYLHGRGTNYSFGPCVFVGYATAMLFFFAAAILLVMNMSKLADNEKRSLIPMLLFMSGAIVVQVAVPELLMTGADVTMVTVGAFFAIENPAEKFRTRAYFDMATQTKNRNAYIVDLAERERNHRRADSRFACVCCDMDGLKAVNDQFGHAVGDYCLQRVAQSMTNYMKHADDIYRVGGDEFIAMYTDVPEFIIEKEVQAVQFDCEQVPIRGDRHLSVALGYAVQEPGESLQKCIERADMEMYRRKRNGRDSLK